MSPSAIEVGASSSSPESRGTRQLEVGGHLWTVAEAEFPTWNDPVGRCLMFTSDAVIRRVRRYPADWYARTDAALFEVSLSI
jgi:hypothetical protein